MEKVWTIVKRLAKEEEGMETVEYAVVAGLVIAVGITVWGALGNRISTVIVNLTNAIGS